MATNFIQIENDSEIKQRLQAERARLRKIAGLDQPTHFHRPVERAFTAEERAQVTILFGGFTWVLYCCPHMLSMAPTRAPLAVALNGSLAR